MSRKHLCQLVRNFKVAMVAILEPFSDVSKMSRLAYLLGLSNFCSNAEMGGKIWVFWYELYEFDVLCMSNQMITGWVRNGVDNLLVTFVYEKCNTVERRGLWDRLKTICMEGPWMVVGDFNIIREDRERVGGNPRPLTSMVDFNECLDSCGLLELAVEGFKPFVEAIWREPVPSSGFFKLAEKLRKVKVALKTWNMNVFRHVSQTIKVLKERLEMLESQLENSYNEEIESEYLITKIELEI
ncbi:uncharacterized protein LOC118344703 [Juglans regia]|uniref:Uncharacterized protein LOC118344703 n=1 Tax=Juglans regia TaxID=51240 RepID=A0A6P9E2W9_JUGRE|nr:uncharacterized protein LOC118344703 [Juglans regia]